MFKSILTLMVLLITPQAFAVALVVPALGLIATLLLPIHAQRSETKFQLPFRGTTTSDRGSVFH